MVKNDKNMKMSYKDMPTYALNLAIWAHLAPQWIRRLSRYSLRFLATCFGNLANFLHFLQLKVSHSIKRGIVKCLIV